MAFVVEDGTGLANATALVSEADADGYHLDRGNAAWGVLSSPTKQSLIIKATDYLRNAAVYPWKGRKATANQSLSWPRTGVVETGGDLIGDTVIPLAVKQAVADLALIANTTVLQPVAATAAAGVKRKKVDVIETEYFQEGSSATTTNPAAQTAQTTAAFGLLMPFLRTVNESLSVAAPYANLPPARDVERTERPLFDVGQFDNRG